MKLLNTLLSMQRPAGSANEVRALSEIHLELLAEEYNTGPNKVTIQRIPTVGLEVTVGDKPTVMFTAHVDTVHHVSQTQEVFTDEAGRCFAEFEGKPCVLGADDAAGVYLLCRLIKNNTKGLYVFFQSEECGGVGSYEYSTSMLPAEIKQCVSFDRRGYYDVITHQGCTRCCSDAYAESLCIQLNEAFNVEHLLGYMPSDDGVFTDSANFADLVPECTNLSVGYFKEHTTGEYLDLTFLTVLAECLCKIRWEELPIDRDPKVVEDLWGNSDWIRQYFKDRDDVDVPEDDMRIPCDEAEYIYGEAKELLKKYQYSGEVPEEVLVLLEDIRDLLYRHK